MPNRLIKESAFTSEKISSLSDFEFRVWVGLITQADDAGRGDARPAIIKGRIFPFRDRVTVKDIDAAVHGLAAKGCVSLYTVGGKPYFWFPSWSEHQRIRDCKPKYPAPEDADDMEPSAAICGELRQVAASCGELPQTAASCGYNPNPNPNPNPNTNPLTGKRARPREGDVFAELSEPLREAMSEFKRFRSMAKKPMTGEAITRMLSKLERLSGGDEDKKIAILRQSIDRGWADVYELKEDGNGTTTGRVEQTQQGRVAGSDQGGEDPYAKLRFFGRPDLI